MNTKDTTEVAENSHHLKIFLPKKLLECLPRCALLPPERLRWNTNEEIASYLITFEKHDEWLSCAPKTRPQNGSIILYNRKKVKYRKDGYLWKKRKDGKTTREDHMKLKVQGMEPVSWQCLYGCYVHSSIVPTFHRRCYWLLQNPDIVLVHYLNVPALEDCGKGCSPIFCSISSDRREWLKWSREELLGQLKPMFHGIKWSCGNGTEEFSVEQLVQQILDTHPTKPAPRTHACLCSGGLDNQFRMSILERLEQMEKRMAEIAAAGQAPYRGPDAPPIQDEGQGPGFEARVVVLVESMIPRSTWRGPERLAHGSPFRGMSLLHLAAAQGYARLIETLSQWRSVETGSLDLEQEVDPLNVDHFSCTPLMWACALGHLEAAVLLFRWNRQALSIPDSLGRLPLSVAHSRGHVRLARCLEELQRQEASAEPPFALSPPSSSPDTGLSSVSSPSELSDGTFSVTSAYSSAPDGSPPPAPLPTSEITMEMVPGQLSSGAPEAPLLLMDYEATNPKGPPPSPPPLPPAPDGRAAPAETDSPPAVDVIPVDMISLAKQIIEATPERIKREDFVGLPEAGAPMRERTGAVGLSETMSWLASYLENVDHFPSSAPPSELPFERGRLAIPPAPSWAEFLSASASGKMESDFALLTLSDHEQRELYEAARVIQTAFRKYKGRRLKEQQEVAAAVIQRCYRKYKQFALYKKMTQAAILIQSKFRSYYEQKRFQQSRRAAVLIQQHYRSYRRRPGPPHRPTGTLPARNKGSFLTKKQDQAARKIMRFLRRCRHRMRELKQNQELEGLPQPGLAT
ncbi:calmodulin-binding transcription activator 2 isoform X9 [Sagmatias obliquidens]|uniref:calmodulin-binding transcription activator 2 isoform X9 n=1 Tax=Sagmatias obliquidens TaxID=3371155 RepID=UPI000F443E1F|nr:calmodulin-binding transcription activator 2 isoform X9 [Lagenorhynchus obliquidens]